MRLHWRFRRYSFWYRMQTALRSRKSFSTVIRATPVIRAVALSELPSTSALITRTCCSVLNLFILALMLARAWYGEEIVWPSSLCFQRGTLNQTGLNLLLTTVESERILFPT